MHNLYANFVKILDVCKKFSANPRFFPLCLFDTICQLCRDAKSCVSPTGDTILQPWRRKILRLYIWRHFSTFSTQFTCACVFYSGVENTWKDVYLVEKVEKVEIVKNGGKTNYY